MERLTFYGTCIGLGCLIGLLSGIAGHYLTTGWSYGILIGAVGGVVLAAVARKERRKAQL